MMSGSIKVSAVKAIPLIIAGFFIFCGSAQATSIVVTPATAAAANSVGSSPTERQESIDAVTDAVCDPNVYERMKQKAWAEAERETYVNQSLILKPDSLFDITCFSQQLAQSKNLCIPDANGRTTNCERTIDGIAGNALQFSAGGVNGRAPLTPNKNAPRNAQGNPVLPTTDQNWDASPNRAVPFRCEEMRRLWQQSQCGNFTAGDLPSLQETGSSREARNYPNSCSADLRGSTGNTLVAGVPDKNDQTTGATLYKSQRVLEDIHAPLADLPNATPTDTKACDTAPYADLAGLGCQQQSGQEDLCAPRQRGNTEGTVNGVTVKYLATSCQPGCSPQLSGNKLICKKTP